MIPVFEKVKLSEHQLYAVGYGDGLAGRPRDKRFSDSLDYTMGHTMGRRDNPNSLENVGAIAESPLERGWADELLNPFPG